MTPEEQRIMKDLYQPTISDLIERIRYPLAGLGFNHIAQTGSVFTIAVIGKPFRLEVDLSGSDIKEVNPCEIIQWSVAAFEDWEKHAA